MQIYSRSTATAKESKDYFAASLRRAKQEKRDSEGIERLLRGIVTKRKVGEVRQRRNRQITSRHCYEAQGRRRDSEGIVRLLRGIVTKRKVGVVRQRRNR